MAVFRYIVLFSLFVCSDVVMACKSIQPTDEMRAQMIKDAYYIGIMKIIDREEIALDVDENGNPSRVAEYKLKLQLYNDYRDSAKSFPEIIFAYGFNSSCSHYPKKVGAIFEHEIYMREEGFFLKEGARAFTTEHLAAAREKVGLDEDVIALKNKCEAGGGVWHGPANEYSYTFFCRIPTSDHGKLCENSAQCEGSCIAELTQDEEIDVWLKRFTAQKRDQLKFDQTGNKRSTCSQWLHIKGCDYVRYDDVVMRSCN